MGLSSRPPTHSRSTAFAQRRRPPLLFSCFMVRNLMLANRSKQRLTLAGRLNWRSIAYDTRDAPTLFRVHSRWWQEAHHPPAHARFVAGAGGAVRRARRLQRLLVYVLADRRGLSPAGAGAKQGGLSRGGEAWSAPRPARLRRCRGRRLGPGDAPPLLGAARS